MSGLPGVSQAFADAVRGEHVVISRIEVERNGLVVARLAAHAGRVDADRSAAHLRRFSAEVADETGELTPGDVRDVLAPFGTVVRVYRGVRLSDVHSVTSVADRDDQWQQGQLVSLTADEGDLTLGFVDDES